MKISEIFKKGEVVSYVNKIKRYSAVNIDFINRKGVEDQTQLDVENNILTKAGVKELEDLWESLSKEFNAAKNSVTGITIVASAQTKEQLEKIAS